MKKTFQVGDRVKCNVGNMGQVCTGTIEAIKPAVAHLPPRLSIAGKITNHGGISWHGEKYADEVKKI